MKKRRKKSAKKDPSFMAGVDKKPQPKKKKVIEKDTRPPKAKPEGKEKAELVTKSTPDKEDQLERLEKFFTKMGPSGMIFMGIDPGTDGSIGLIHPHDNSLTTAVDIPTTMVSTQQRTKSKKGFRHRAKFDYGMIIKYFEIISQWRHRVQVCLETGQARNTDNGITGLGVGIGYGMWPLFLMQLDIPCTEFIPSVWKVKMGLARKDKEYSRLFAQRQFPSAPLFNKKHHNRAEALLLAEFLRRQHATDS